MPRVSVIVAAHNAAATLPVTLASIAAQTFRDWQIVVVDDGSTDATGEIARSFPHPARVLRSDRPLGPGAARNLAVQHAEGELLAILDADDEWRPEYLDHQVALYDEAVAAGAAVGLVTCDALLRGPDGELQAQTFADRVQAPERITLNRLLAENSVFTSVLMPRAVFDALGGYEPGLRHGEDYDLWLRVVERGFEAVSTPRALAVYSLRPDSLTAETVGASASIRLVYERALARGRLTRRQRRLARRQARLHGLLEDRARIALAATAGEPVLARRLRALPRTARIVLEHPERWWHWLRRGPRLAGPGRHA